MTSPVIQTEKTNLYLTTGKTELHIQGPYGSSEWEIDLLQADLAIAVNKVFPIWTAAINFRRNRNEIEGFELSSKRTRELMFKRVGNSNLYPEKMGPSQM